MKIQGLQLSETGMQEGRLEVVSKPGSCDPNAFLSAFVIRTSELFGSRNLCLWVTPHPENQTLSAGNLVYIIWQDGWLTKELDIFVGSANNFLKKAIRHDCSPNNTQLLLEWELSAPLTNEKMKKYSAPLHVLKCLALPDIVKNYVRWWSTITLTWKKNKISEERSMSGKISCKSNSNNRDI